MEMLKAIQLHVETYGEKMKKKSKQREEKERKKKGERDASLDVENIMCTFCNGGEDEDKILLCDTKGCENAYHMYCLRIPLKEIPNGDWFCDECIDDLFTTHPESQEKGKNEFGFQEGKQYTMESFRKMANQFKRKWFKQRKNQDKDEEAEQEEEKRKKKEKQMVIRKQKEKERKKRVLQEKMKGMMKTLLCR